MAETTPLLHPDYVHGNEDPPGTIDRNSRPGIFSVVFICTLCILTIDVGIFLQMAPLTRILESIVCRSYYQKLGQVLGDIPESECKISAIQGRLAMLKGWSALSDCLPSVFLAVPYGLLADKYGRKPVLCLSIIGVVMSDIWLLIVCRFPNVFAVELIWLSPAFNIIGGGPGVASSVILTSVADVVTEGQRSTSFFRITASLLVSQLVAIPISSILMEIKLWLPMFLGLGAMVLGGMMVVMLPETLKQPPRSGSIPPSPDSEIIERENCEDHNLKAYSFDALVRNCKWIVDEYRSVFVSPIVATLIFTFLINSLGRSSVDLLLQYASRRYHWTIAQAGFLFPLRASVQLALLLLILPCISYFLTDYMSVNAKLKDLYILRGSVGLLMLGSIGIGLSPNPVVMAIFLIISALGSGFATTVRSLATSLVEPGQVGRLYAAMTTMEMIGGMIAGPLLSALYGFGLILDGFWVGLPFLASGALFLIVALPLWILSLGSHPST